MTNPILSPLSHFGAELRHYREAAGLSQERLAALVGQERSLIAKIETAKRTPSLPQAEKMDQALGTGGVLERLWPLVDQHADLHSDFGGYVPREPDAEAIHTYATGLVPGLLQTPEYARSTIEAERPALAPDVVEARLAARATRQDVLLRDDPPRLWVILAEPVLRLHVGSRRVMAEQLEHLLECAKLPHITIQVLPDSAGVTAVTQTPFLLADFAEGPPALHIDAPPGVSIRSDTEATDRFKLIFDHLRASALSEADTVFFIAQRLKELTDGE